MLFRSRTMETPLSAKHFILLFGMCYEILSIMLMMLVQMICASIMADEDIYYENILIEGLICEFVRRK